MLAGKCMRRFVYEEGEACQPPKLKDVPEAFFFEIVKLQRVLADLSPAVDEYVKHEREADHAQCRKQSGVDEFYPGINSVKAAVGVPCCDNQMGYISVTGLLFGLLLPCLAQPLLQHDILFQRRSIPKIGRIQTLNHGLHICRSGR